MSHKPDVFQQQVICAQGNALRVVAPAGSGKTETLVRRVIERTGPGGVDPRRVLMLTFDNNGQQSFKRLLKLLAPRQNLPKFQTFNKFGIGILQTYFSEDMSQIVKDQELLPFRREIGSLPILRWDERPRDLIETFRALKDQGLRPDEDDRKRASAWLRSRYLELPLRGDDIDLFGGERFSGKRVQDEAAQLDQVFDAYLQYEHELRRRGRMDFQDQKLRPLIRLVQNKKITAQERLRYDEVIIDEAQDISRLDALLIWHVIGAQTTITLAGDDDQTIYEFKQSSSVFLRDAAKYFEREFETFQLNINYRSPEAILAPAQRLIANNVERIEKTATAARIDPGEVTVLSAATERDRIEQVGRWIHALHEGNDFAWHEVAIPAPKNPQLTAFANVLARLGVPTKLNTGKNDDGTTVIDAVELSTIHKAKGRQWRAVVLPLSGEGEMPGAQEVREGKLEGERRAYYVSMSRAADMLCVAYVRKGEQDTIRRSASGEVTGTTGASRFLFEAGLVQDWQPEIAADKDTPVAIVVPVPTLQPTPPAPETIPDAIVTSAVPSIAERLRQRDQQERKRIGRLLAPPLPPEIRVSEEAPVSEPKNPIAIPPIPIKRSRAERAAGQSSVKDTLRLPKNAPPPSTPQTISAEIRGYLEKAEANLQMGDSFIAGACAWMVVEAGLAQLLAGRMSRSDKAIDKIDFLRQDLRVSPEWISRLHRFRIVRNNTVGHWSEKEFDKAESERVTREMVQHLRPFLALGSSSPSALSASQVRPPSRMNLPTPPEPTLSTEVSSRPAPVASVLPPAPIVPPATPATWTASGKLHPVPTDNLVRILGFLSRGGINPDTKQPVRSIMFHTVNDGIEFLPLQLGLILYDIRFFVPEQYRYSSSPIFASFCKQNCPQDKPIPLPRNLRNAIPERLRGFEPRLLELLSEMLDCYWKATGTYAVGSILLARLQDAEALHNGAAPRGIQLIPRR